MYANQKQKGKENELYKREGKSEIKTNTQEVTGENLKS